jgi:hypothetical protein
MKRALRGLAFIAVALSLGESVPLSARPIQVYGVWHCGSDLCGWDTVRDMTDFDAKNQEIGIEQKHDETDLDDRSPNRS